MNIFLSLFLLGLVQGLTEFLPVSSSGHLVLLTKLIGIDESLFMSILLHEATLFSIVVVFYKDIWQMIRHPFSTKTMQIVAATIPTCLIVLVIMPLVKQSFMGGFLPLCFAITAILLCASQSLAKRNVAKELDSKTAIIMGIAQGFAVFPGISRSGSTICAGYLAGGDRKQVTKFSFLMSIPIIFLSMIMEIYDVIVGGVQITFPVWAIILSFLTAFVVGVLAIKLMMKITEKSWLIWFSIYLVIIAIISLFVI